MRDPDLQAAIKDSHALLDRLAGFVAVAEEGEKRAHDLWRKAEAEVDELRAQLAKREAVIEENTPRDALLTAQGRAGVAEKMLAKLRIVEENHNTLVENLRKLGLCEYCAGVGETTVEVDGSPWTLVCSCSQSDARKNADFARAFGMSPSKVCKTCGGDGTFDSHGLCNACGGSGKEQPPCDTCDYGPMSDGKTCEECKKGDVCRKGQRG